jgi:hypothetical protein
VFFTRPSFKNERNVGMPTDCQPEERKIMRQQLRLFGL